MLQIYTSALYNSQLTYLITTVTMYVNFARDCPYYCQNFQVCGKQLCRLAWFSMSHLEEDLEKEKFILKYELIKMKEMSSAKSCPTTLQNLLTVAYIIGATTIFLWGCWPWWYISYFIFKTILWKSSQNLRAYI